MPPSAEHSDRTLTRRRFLTTASGAVAGAALIPSIPAFAAGPPAQSAPPSELWAGFQDPPLRARPGAYWVWPDGYFDPGQITRELEDLREKGLSSLEIFDIGARDEADVVPAGPAFMSPEAVRGYAHAVREATRLGLKLGLITSSSWNAGGPWVTPALAGKALYASETRVTGPGLADVTLPYPEVPEPAFQGIEGGDDPWAARPVYTQDVAVQALPARADRTIASLADVIDLTARLGPDGRLRWDVPDGEWVILRIVCSNNRERLVLPSPHSDGYMIDHLSAEATEAHFRVIIDRLREALGSFEDTALEYLYLPSYEVRGLTEWTPTFAVEFRRRRGYDVHPFLPVLFGWTIATGEISQRFDHDRRLTISDLLVENHYGKAAEVCHEYGLELHAESGGPGKPFHPTHDFPAESLSALNAVDVPRGEFWVRQPPGVNDSANVIKAVGSAIHIYGKRIAEMESFTGFDHWTRGPFDLKPYADRVLCEGANRFVFHTYPHNPPEAGKPGWAYHAGTHIGMNRAWWPMVQPFIAYLARSSYLLQEGLFVADVCFYYGHDAPLLIANKHFDVNAASMGLGYDYDYVNTDVLLNRMSVQAGRLVLPDGMSYGVLVLPDREDMPLEVLEHIERLVRAGATVVGPKPVRTPQLYARDERVYRERDAQLRALADRLWGAVDGVQATARAYGDGRVALGRPVRDVLVEQGIEPDFTFTGAEADAELDFIHRRVGDEEVYFVCNLKDRWEQLEGSFRVIGKQPTLWMPETGERRAVRFDSAGGRTRVGLVLPPYGSAFVVFRETEPDEQLVAFTRDGVPLFHLSPSGATGPVAVEVRLPETGAPVLVAWQEGTYTAQTSGGEVEHLEVPHQPSLRIDGPWEVQFPDGWGAPRSITFPELTSWTDHPMAGIRYFSGIATYACRFDLPPDAVADGTCLSLDLGDLRHVAEVYLNDRPLGVVWKPPYLVDLGDAAEAGENRLRIRVANVWANRLLGDRVLRPAERFTNTNLSLEAQHDTLVPSGLLGPVNVRFGTTRLL